MTSIHATNALLPSGLGQNVRVTISAGRISSVETGGAALPGDERVSFLVPAVSNLHSHAFQRAMAGLAEARGPGADSFWSWRNVMYRFALSMTPDDVEAVAAKLYVEMLEAGFARVGEFHYLHHDQNGRAYANPAEMAERIAAASATAGISLTLLPVFYAHSGFGGARPVEGQRRFIHDVDAFQRLMEHSAVIVSRQRNARLGLAPHSLRAVTPEELSAILPMAGDGPIHIHVAEQTKEVDDCIAWSGKRPVEWLLDTADVNPRWCLIHATHMTDSETRRLAATGAVAGLCPLTEANLGDGVFPASNWRAAGGRFGVGSDSNVEISLAGELKMLEYSQRLAGRARNVIADPGQSTGTALYESAVTGGASALGETVSGIQVGAAADLLSLDIKAAAHVPPAQILDHFVFSRGIRIEHVWAGGARRVTSGHHLDREAVDRRFRAVMADLMARQ